MKFRLGRIHLEIGRLMSDEDFTFMDKLPDVDVHLGFVRKLRISDKSGRDEIDEDIFFPTPSPLLPPRRSNILYESSTIQQLPEEVLQTKAKIQECWVRVARFISRLSCLSDLVYDCNAQVPMCLLSALRDNCPDVRLHVYTFRLRSLYQPRNECHDISLEEFALATSPNLYGLYMRHCFYTAAGYIGYNEEAVIQMVQGLAPRLSYVGMVSKPQGNTIELDQAWKLHRQSGKPKWKGFFINNDQTYDKVHKKGSLHTLHIRGASEMRIRQWSGYTDFSKLTKLHLGDTMIEAVQVLATIGESDGLSSLSSLSLGPTARSKEQAMAIDGSVCRLLRAINPLQSLELENEIGDGAWRAVIDRHGSSLRELRFVPVWQSWNDVEVLVLSYDKIRLLSSVCSQLEKLELRVPRTNGDDDEIDIYRNLGRLPRLKHISLILQCSIINPPEARSGETLIDMENDFWKLPVSVFRAALTNTAMDSVLAQSIFETIATTRAYVNGYSLVTLKLQIHGAGHFGHSAQSWADYETTLALQWIARKWLVRRDFRDGGLVVQEIESIYHDQDVLKDDFFERDDLRAVWMDVWPGSPGDRRNQWHSFPLPGSTNWKEL
ncbi:hypothetical protein TrVFT333_008607 [Trichoderma virens FT-333]|nr:hypothetical protein TrVFT333_008607 [Trichoderma virens FT-333]